MEKTIKRKYAPLSSNFLLTAILGFLITFILTVYGNISLSWGIAFGIVFVIMFIAAMLSMTRAPVILPEEFEVKKKK